jgi:hypothetical protein
MSLNRAESTGRSAMRDRIADDAAGPGVGAA